MHKKLIGTLCALVLVGAPLLTSAQTTHKQFSWPTESRSITQYFSAFHTGVDIEDDLGSSVTAAEPGKVLHADCSQEARGASRGCYVVLQNGKHWKTLYEHLDSVTVTTGDYITAGETIATVGNTGRSTGPHLHFEMRKKNATGAKYHGVNPLKHLQ